MPGNLGLAMKELDAAEVRAVTFFLFFFERCLLTAQGASSKASQSHASFKGSRSLRATLANWWELPGVINRGCRTMFMHQQEGG